MALGIDHITVKDVHSRLIGKDKAMAKTLEFMKQTDPFMDDMGWVQCNSGDNHEYKFRTGLPEAHVRAVNDYIPMGKSTTKKGIATTSSIDALAEIDAEFIDGTAADGKGNEIRADEAKATIMGIGNKSAEQILYASLKTNPKSFDGFMTRYGKISTNKENIGYNVIDAEGTGSNLCSIIVANFSPQTVYGIFPKGGSIGVTRKQYAETIDKNEDGDGRPVYRDRYNRKLGLCIEDWRSTIRIVNVDVDDLHNIDIVALLIKAYYRIPNFVRNIEGVNPVIYCPTPIAAALTTQAIEKTSPVKVGDVEGKPITSFWGYKIKECDSMLTTEERVL